MESLIKQLYKPSLQLMRELWTELVIGKSPAYRWCLKTLAWIRPSRLWFNKRTESRMELWNSLMLRSLWEEKINLQRWPRRSYKWHHKPYTFPLHPWHNSSFQYHSHFIPSQHPNASDGKATLQNPQYANFMSKGHLEKVILIKPYWLNQSI